MGRLSTVDLLILYYNFLVAVIFILKILITLVAIQATLMRRSAVLSLPLQLVFPGVPVSVRQWQLFTK